MKPILSLLCLVALSSCQFIDSIRQIESLGSTTPINQRSYYDAQEPQPKEFYDWMDEVGRIADYNVDGDEMFFCAYWRAGESPKQAIEHFRRDYVAWNGGGDP